MEVKKERKEENAELMIVFYLVMILGTLYALTRIGLKVIENIN
ncbi:hypothetical protein [Croceivirga thetidis]|nr:hypothetical protein [Croceivirga thetidis]